MYQCACCGEVHPRDLIRLIIDPALSILRVCTLCLDLLWENRNPAKLAEQEENIKRAEAQEA